ncbi:hypothetical protein M408DRAFT_327157 [Serendipita vermifera MAFF 305830]|uniref:non-specific serine/threonine protein kinase n=1 Tax=Serendipita vermifera MAFF 305830 TaxID=933852 RepID=A0A0C3B4E0_SERVB|nr:hypothetical protein M408DRAFT_327157 [Serendipita vermifera MAFF 305830]
MPASVDIKPTNGAAANNSNAAAAAARPVIRMDAQDGPWSVSVAETSPRSLTLYIKTPTHHLTLMRTAHEIAELHFKLQDQVPTGTTLPPCPLEADHPQKRKSSFLTTLSRLASPPRQPAPTSSSSSPPQNNGNDLSPQPENNEITDPFLSAEPSATSALASYLTTLSNDKAVRVARSWKRFVRVRTDDLESTRVERAIKRVRSDVAMHGGTGGSGQGVPLISTTAPGSTRTSFASGDDGFYGDRKSSAFPGQSIVEEDEGGDHGLLHPQAVTPDTASADEHARRLIISGMVDFTPAPEPAPVTVRRPPVVQPVETQAETEYVDDKVSEKEEQEQTQVQEEYAAPEPEQAKPEEKEEVKPVEKRISRISRSASLDRASRVSRSIPESPIPAVQSETDAEVAEATDMTDAEDTDAFGASAMSDAGGPGIVDQPPKKKKKKQKLEKKARKVVITDFEMMRVLGKGCAGKVLLVRHKREQSLYALKAITKRHVIAHQELQHTMTEQAVLKRMARSNSDPFVVKLYWSFHDKENLFLVMDFHPGGDLATQLARWGRLGRDRARFYAAEIVEGCEGLHAAGVIYRDLKPENILIGGDGHIVLTDFGLSKEFPRKRPSSMAPNGKESAGGDFYASSPSTPTGEKHGLPYWMHEGGEAHKDMWLATKANDLTTTFCGTAEYLAPEVIQGLPYSYEVDWWSFGTMLYEMLTGITPFWANNHSDMYVRVLQDELTFPEDKAMDQDTKSLVRGLLQRNPALRLCEPRIKRHPYFSMIDWQHVYHKRYIPPYIPPIDPANASDTQNFDDAFLEMEPILDSEIENDDQTGSERDRSTTEIDRQFDEDSVRASPNVDSPDAKPEVENDVFDGYSFKARHSVIIDDEAGGSDASDEESIPEKESISISAEDELEAGQKTPDAHVQVIPPTPTPASAVVEAFRKQQEAKEIKAEATIVPEAETEEADVEAVPTTPRNKAEELPAEAAPVSASPEKELPAAPEATKEKVRPTSVAPPVPAKEEKKVVTISETPKPKPAEHHKPKAARNVKSPRRERSGVAALDRDLNDAIDEHDEMGIDREDDDWDFVETPGGHEDYNGQQNKSLFARGVVDRYRLKVFRKPSTPGKATQRNAFTTGPPPSEEFGELTSPASPSPSNKKRRGGGLSLGKGRTFLRPKSPSATYSAGSSGLSRPGLSMAHSATVSGSTSGVLLTPSSSTPLSMLPTNGTTSLKSQPSMNSVGSPGSSDTSVNGMRPSAAPSTADLPSPGKGRSRSNKSSPDLRRQARESQTDVDEPRQKGLRKMRKYTAEGAEKVLSLFSSPRPSPAPSPSQ